MLFRGRQTTKLAGPFTGHVGPAHDKSVQYPTRHSRLLEHGSQTGPSRAPFISWTSPAHPVKSSDWKTQPGRPLRFQIFKPGSAQFVRFSIFQTLPGPARLDLGHNGFRFPNRARPVPALSRFFSDPCQAHDREEPWKKCRIERNGKPNRDSFGQGRRGPDPAHPSAHMHFGGQA